MLFTINNGLSIGQNYPTSIKTDGEDGGQGFVEDYRNALTTSLQYYYRALAEWSKNYVGAEFSGQIGYNLPVDGVSTQSPSRYLWLTLSSRKLSPKSAHLKTRV